MQKKKKKKRQNREGRCSGELRWRVFILTKWSPKEWATYEKNVLICSIQRWAESDYLSVIWTKTLYSQAEGQDPLRQAIEYYYKQKSKKYQVKVTVSNMESKLVLFL